MANQKKQTKEDIEKEKKSLETLVNATEISYAINLYKGKAKGSIEARENSKLLYGQFIKTDSFKEYSAEALGAQGFEELDEKSPQKIGGLDVVNAHSGQHLKSLYGYNLEDLMLRISQNCGYDKKKLDESFKKYYNKTFGDIAVAASNEKKEDKKAKIDYATIMQLYNQSIEAKYAQVLSKLKIDNILEARKQSEKKPQKPQEAEGEQ